MLIRPIDISSFVNDFLTVPRMLHPGRKFNFLKKPTFLKGFKPRQAALPELHLNAFMRIYALPEKVCLTCVHRVENIGAARQMVRCITWLCG